jgi:hypothetical protein
MRPSASCSEEEIQMSDAPVKTRAHLGVVLHPSPRMLKEAMADVDGFNAKFAERLNAIEARLEAGSADVKNPK